MAVINDPNIAANVARVGMGAGMIWTPQQVVPGPVPVGAGGSYRLAIASGTMAAALGANSEVFQFRYVTGAARVALVHSIIVSAAQDVAAGAAALLALRATVARAYTVAGSGGGALTLTGNNNKLRSGHATCEAQARVATTAALVAGTQVLDAQDIALVAYNALTGAITTAPSMPLLPKTVLFGSVDQPMAAPLILGHEEGFVLRTLAANPAGMTWHFGVEVAWSEVDAF